MSKSESKSAPVQAVLDFEGLFAGLPTAYLVMDLDLVIVEANRAYLELLGRTREELVGRWTFDAFPPTPEALDEQGRNPLQLSFETARATGRPVAMPLYKYDVLDASTGQVVERYWSLISAPLLDEDGKVVLLLQRVEDVTDYVREREGQRVSLETGQERVLAVEADLFKRVEELRAAQEARDVTARRLAGLNEVALALTAAESVEDLEEIIIGRGMSVLGADGGAVVCAAEPTALGHQAHTGGVGSPRGGWRVTLSEVIGEHAQAKYGLVPYDSPLPACESARTGQRIELPTVAEGLARFPSMGEVYRETGRLAWVFLPLTVKGERLGCLAVSWADERRLFEEELDLLEGLAAQCAQTLARIQTLEAERRAAVVDRGMSAALQRALLTEPVQPDHLQIAVRYLPAVEAAQIGGDWYDAFTTGDGTTSLVIGDVAGHDREAAATMGQARNLLRGIGYAVGEPPARVLSQLDRAFADLGIDALATLVLAQVEQDEHARARGLRVLRWSNAGHLPPLLVQPDTSVEFLRTDPDLLLGLNPDTPRTDHQVVLQPGATVLLYTDGLVERRGASIEGGLRWLEQAVQELTDLPLEDLCDRLLSAVGDVEDDIALVALRAHPEDEPRPPEAGPRRDAAHGPRWGRPR